MSRRGGRGRAALALAALLWLPAAGPAVQPAHEDVATLSAELARLQAMVHDEHASDEARRDSAERAHKVRARLIELAPMSIHTPTWLADQAADALAVALADYDDLSVVFGLASPPETARVRAAAEEAATLLARARQTGEQLVARLEQELFEQDTPEQRVAAIEHTLGKLIDEELEARVPLLSAQASVLLAASSRRTGQDREGVARAREAARSALEELTDLRYRTPQAEAHRLALTGAALLAAAATSAADGADTQMRARAREQFRAAAAKLESVEPGGADPRAAHGQDAVLRATVRLGLLRTGGPDPARLAVEREALLEQGRALIEAWEGSPLQEVMREGVCAEMLARDATDGAWVAQALAILVEPVALEGQSAASRARDIGAKVVAALRLAAPAPAPDAASSATPPAALRPEQLPPKAALVAAMSLEGTDDVATLGQRLRLLRAAASEEHGAGVDVATRAEALWRLAAALAESERTAELIEGTEALASLIRIATARSERFEAAVRAGPELGHFAVARAAAGSDAAQGEAARRALARVLFAVLQREEAGAIMTAEARNGARLELAGLLLTEAARGQELEPLDRAAMLEEIIWVLEGLSPEDSRPGRTAGAADAAPLVREAAGHMVRAVVLARRLPHEQRLEVTRRALAWGDDRHALERVWLRLEHARALLDAGDPAALRAIEPLATLGWPDAERAAAGGVSIAEIRLTLAQAQRAAGNAAAAFATLRDLTTALDQALQESPAPAEPDGSREPGEAPPAAAGTRHPIFWEAWAEMLDMLADANTDGSRTAEMRLHLNRLALIDEDFGGGQTADRIRDVRERLGR